ncbi:hypothetical protein NMG60_11005521 [Bertholletia excelsa]
MNLSRWGKGIAMDSYGASKNKQIQLDDEFLRGCTPKFPGIVVQSVKAPPCQGGSCGFEPRQSRQI